MVRSVKEKMRQAYEGTGVFRDQRMYWLVSVKEP